MCNSVKLDSGDEFFIDWERKLIEEPGRWNSQLDDLWKHLDEEKRHDEVACGEDEWDEEDYSEDD